MKKHLLAVLVFAALGVYGCGVIDIKDTGALTYNEHMKLGAIYESKGEFDLALREYGDAQTIDTKEPRVYFALGNVYLKMKDYDNAEKEYLKSIELGAAPDFYNNLSWVYIEKGQLDEARKAVNAAVAIAQPEKGYIYLDTLGVVLMKAGQHAEAEESFMKAADSVPGINRKAYLAIYGHLVELYKKEGKTEEASIVEEKLKLYESAIEGTAKPGI
jgi:tetratricopeptide (TPR) repeat protein